MAEKKPAHEFILAHISKIVTELQTIPSGPGSLGRILRSGALWAHAETLKNMDIPEKHREEVADSLRKLVTRDSEMKKYFKESLISEISSNVSSD
jgi:hypothetical protein